MDLEINTNKKNSSSESNNFSSELTNYINKTNSSFSIDRFEGEFAVCENRETGDFVNIPKSELPANCKPGSILKFENGKYILDIEETKKEQDTVKNMVSNLFKRKN